MNKLLLVLSAVVLLFALVQGTIVDEGIAYAKSRQLQQTTAPRAPPPSYFYPPPTAVTNRALLYNRRIQLTPGEYLVYTPANMFDVIGAPPSVLGPVERVLDNQAAVRTLTPQGQTIFSEIGPALASVPKPAQQSFINLLTPDIKNVPSVSTAIQQAGLQANPPPPSTPTPPGGGSSTPPGGASSNIKVAFSLISVLIALFYILF